MKKLIPVFGDGTYVVATEMDVFVDEHGEEWLTPQQTDRLEFYRSMYAAPFASPSVPPCEIVFETVEAIRAMFTVWSGRLPFVTTEGTSPRASFISLPQQANLAFA